MTNFRWRVVILPAIVICTVFGVLLGPSSVTAMRPTSDYWPAGENTFWLNASADDFVACTSNPSIKWKQDLLERTHNMRWLERMERLGGEFLRLLGS